MEEQAGRQPPPEPDPPSPAADAPAAGQPADARRGEPAEPARPVQADLPQAIQEWASRIGTVAAAGAGLVVVVHLLGGVVMWLRFRKAGLPADQALAFMTREQMLTIGLRLIVLPVLATGALALALVWARRRRLRRQRERPGKTVDGTQNLDLRARLVLFACAGVVALLFLSLPFSWASVTWIGLGLVVVYWWRGFGLEPRPRDAVPSPWRLAAVAILAAAFISLGRQVDDPVQLLQVEVALDGRKGLTTGAFVGADSDAVYVGDTETHKITGYRRGDVKSVALGPPFERAPNRSVLSALLSDDSWAITPLRWWCNGEVYAWGEVGDLCQTQPTLRPERRALDIAWLPVNIRCPAEARRPCQGHMRFETTRTYGGVLGPQALPRRVRFPREGSRPVPFTLLEGRTREFCVRTSPEERALLRAAPDGLRRPERPVRLDVVLSSDARGQSVLTRAGYKLDVSASGTDPSLIPASGCGGPERAKLAAETPRAASGEAVGVLDRDTIEVRIADRTVRVRLLGIDPPPPPTPPSLPTPKAPCGDRERTDFLLRRLFTAPRDSDRDGLADAAGGEARTVDLEPDPERADRDAVRSELLRHVTIRGERRTLQEQLLSAGWARPDASGRPLAIASELADAANTARRERRGVHRLC